MKSGDPENPVLYPPVWSNIYYRKTQLRKEIEEVAEKYLSYGEKQILVDYGCGTKPYEPILSSYVSEYIGLDITEAENVDRVLAEDGTSSLPDSTADVVLSSQVLEHVPDPVRYLNEAHRLLEKDGLLLLSTHGHMIYHPVPEDYWRWTHRGLRKMLKQTNFTIEELRGIIGKAATGGQFLLDGVRPALPEACQGAFNLLMQGIISFLDHDVFNPNLDKDASIFLVVARKR